MMRESDALLVGLEKLWGELWETAEFKGDKDAAWRILCENYQESSRFYHNFGHIRDCLEIFYPIRSLFENKIACECALWFHDVVYDTHSGDNEERSAKMAFDMLKSWRYPEAGLVRKLIMVTKHPSIPETMDEKLIVDIDISILASQKMKYEEYERNIREEYRWVPHDQFIQARSKLMNEFLEKEHIFNSEHFIEMSEGNARRNISRVWVRKETVGQAS